MPIDPEQEMALRLAELRLTRKHNRSTVVTALVVALVSNVVVVTVALRTLNTTAEQFELSSVASEYNDIIQGLSSSAGAVEINSIRRLQTFIEEDDNFADSDRQQAEAANAIQTLIAYIKEMGSFTNDGLAEYRSPHPPVVLPAISALRNLLSNPDLGDHSVDLGRVDMHGVVNLRGFHPFGDESFLPSVDLRGAILENMDLRDVKEFSTLHRSFLTCADLRMAKLGDTNMAYVDLSGANLTDADLSGVRNLTPEQLTGVTTSDITRLPDGVTVPAGTPWGFGSDECQAHMNDMTGIRPGAGYDPDVPCPEEREVCAARS
jgi:uncharacterized protein YjbI with pentapeptide repeats